MHLDAVVLPTEGTDEMQEVNLDTVEAGAAQQWMLIYLEDGDRVFAVADAPTAFQSDPADGRPVRWVSIPLIDADPLEVPATLRLEVVYGNDPESLQPLLDLDLYPEADQEALARNGMCPEAVTDDELEPGTPAAAAGSEPEPDPEPVYCGRPSDPASFYRACTDHDARRREESQRYEARQFEPTYGAYAPL